MRDPLRRLPKARDWRERFTRHQLRPVLILEDVLRPILGEDATYALLADVVSHSGARFIASQVQHPAPEAWRAMSVPERLGVAEALLERFGNAEARVVEHSDTSLGFDVTFCHFVALCHTLGRPHLAPLFCKADSVYYEAPGAPVRLQRPQTLAGGGDRCEFRLTFIVAAGTTSAPSARAGDSPPGQTRATAVHR